MLGLDPVLPDTQKEKIKPRTGKEEERQRKEGRAKRDLPSTTTTPTEERDGEKPAQEETSSSGSAMQQDSHPPISSPRETMEVDVELEESEGGGSGGGGSVGGLRIAEEGEIHDDEEEEDNEFEEDEEEDTEEESDARIRRLLEEIAEGMLCICPNLDIYLCLFLPFIGRGLPVRALLGGLSVVNPAGATESEEQAKERTGKEWQAEIVRNIETTLSTNCKTCGHLMHANCR